MRRRRRNKVVVLGGQAPQGALSFLGYLFHEKGNWGPGAKPLVGIRRCRNPPVLPKAQERVNFWLRQKEGKPTPGGSPPTYHIIKEEPPNVDFQRCVLLFVGSTTPTIPQSAHADSSLCTSEPWVGASPRWCRRLGSWAFLGQVLQNHQSDPEKTV